MPPQTLAAAAAATPATPATPLTEDQLFTLCAQKLGTVDSINTAIANHVRQNEQLSKQRDVLQGEIDQIKAAVKTGTPYPPPPQPALPPAPATQAPPQQQQQA